MYVNVYINPKKRGNLLIIYEIYMSFLFDLLLLILIISIYIGLILGWKQIVIYSNNVDRIRGYKCLLFLKLLYFLYTSNFFGL